jgi:hypothetical protein
MNTERFDDANAFLAAAEPLLLADEARHNRLLGLAGAIADGLYDTYRLWLVRDDAHPVAAALRTPPYNLILARPDSPEALLALADAVVSEELPGVVGATPESEEFARLWEERTGASARLGMRQGVYALEAVEPLPTVPGEARVATPADRETVLRWWIAFGEEVLHEGGPGRENAAAMVDYRLDPDTGRGVLLWEHDGEIVSFAGWGGPTPNGARVGPVYTPPELRGRGYATAATAELSRRLLASGRRFCFLYTDLANPTSNAIYERIGYRRVCESAEIVFN